MLLEDAREFIIEKVVSTAGVERWKYPMTNYTNFSPV
jgi:hypothetical protein